MSQGRNDLHIDDEDKIVQIIYFRLKSKRNIKSNKQYTQFTQETYRYTWREFYTEKYKD